MKRPRASSKPARGFALVVTLSLLILLTVIAVGLLTLSSISLRVAGQGEAQHAARANARMALALAIAQLQRETGPDQRITIAADQRSNGGDGSDSSAAETSRFWTGVYGSWPAGVKDRPTPQFRSWLVSGTPEDLARESTADSAGSQTVEMVGAGTLGDSSAGIVSVPTVQIAGPNGSKPRIAWWTGDQGTKAALATPPIPNDNSLGAIRSTLQGAPRNAIELVKTGSSAPFKGLALEDPRLTQVTSWQQSAFLASDPKAPRGLFHDLAPFSTGLLTDVRNGGFRKDLSMQLERNVPSTSAAISKIPLYTVAGEPGINFQELWSYYNLYRQLYTARNSPAFTTGDRVASSTPRLTVLNNADACRNDDWFFYKQPIIISYQLVLSLETRPVTISGQARHRLYVVADPILTFWNPLDVPVVVPTTAFYSIKYWQVPYNLMISVNGGGFQRYPLRTIGGGDGNYLSLRAGELQQLVLKPGEVIKFSQTENTIVLGGSNHNLQSRAGWNLGGGFALPVRDPANQTVEYNQSDSIRYELRPNNLTSGKQGGSGNSLSGGNEHSRHFSLTHHELYVGTDRGQNSLGFGGMYIDWDFGNKRLRPGQIRDANAPGTKFAAGPRLYADRFPQIFKSVTASEGRTLQVAELNQRKSPVVMLSYNAKTENDSELGTRFLARFNPKAHHVDFYDLTQKERDMLPYEFVVEPLYGTWKNRIFEVNQNGSAFFGGGMNAEFGSSFVTTHSVPREPLVSLAAFQHSFANGFEFPRPPFGYATLNGREPMMPQISHAIGNSMAPSVLPMNQTEGRLPGSRPLADHSYLANLALWDEWFLSGIAPKSVNTHGKNLTQRAVAADFFNGESTLPVVRYLPDAGAEDVSSLVGSFFSGANPNNNATQKVASYIKVDGLFNVNSTSVEAWKAMLGSLKGRPIVVSNPSGAETVIPASDDSPVANLNAPQDLVVEGASGISDPKALDQWVGRRTLDEDNIDLLARAIVREVRKRGPFISLADFVNRRVGNDEELARSGAIQSALDSEEAGINSAFKGEERVVPEATAARFAFPAAEHGTLAYGAPGIIKQADILTPIAPVLSARSDSFIIRAYGESVDAKGNVLARAWCEATVQRNKNFVDPSDSPDTAVASLRSEANTVFGRRYDVTSFRWLHSDEV